MRPAAAKLAAWRRDPVMFVRENFHVEPDRWQAEQVLAPFPTDNRIAMTACKGPGKTAVLAWLIWNFIATRPHANVACTSISGDNLQDGLWKELAKWQAKSPFLMECFEWQKTRIVAKEAPATWWASARSWAKSASPEQQANTLAGLHADYMLFVIDEAGGVPLAVGATAEAALASGIETKFVMAGNPTHTDGPLYSAATNQRHLWRLVNITGDPNDPLRSPRVSAEWAKQQIEMYGVDNPWVLVNVFGKFPPSSLDSLLGPEEVQAAMKRHLREDQYSWSQKRLGIDCARFGDDRTVIFPRQGLASHHPEVLRGARGTEIASKVMLKTQEWGAEVMTLDDTGGWGQSTIDTLIAAGHSPIGVQFHAPANDPRYKNRRAEMWMLMAEWVKRGGALPNIPELVGELTTPTYSYKEGKFLIEPKDMVKVRLGRSPDLADALALTFALPEMPAGDAHVVGMHRAGGNLQWEDYAA
jgi:hypothetical protein